MFRKILIANRGEIACRIARTAHRLGTATVAVYSDADAGALHVRLADEAIRIGPAPVAESYLNGDRIIEAALATGAEAIHPGYGFLSENAEYFEKVEGAGLIFIGPPAQAIREMGLKDAAKKLMAAAGVPVVPGYHGDDQSAGRLASEARKTGYPVLIKAVAGGGGKGMRLVEKPDGFDAALASARSEALAAFGNDAVLVEKYIAAPRHIEIQVFGDSHGNVVHLYERDCSLQRRYQKVIEEAPAPGMTGEVREAMCAAAVQAARAIGYQGAGTVEFIADAAQGLRADGFWFMEMNTRLQVEHPVTEAITGIDLVEWQIRVAAGEPLPKTQAEITISGHSVEARLYAEDPAKGFLPATGRLSHLSFPKHARVDTGVRQGDVISPFYDPMIAKLITHGSTRSAALNQMFRALTGARIAGCQSNLAFLARLVRHADFTAGGVDTGLIARDQAALTAELETPPQVLALAALACGGFLGASGPFEGFHLWSPLVQTAHFKYGDAASSVDISVLSPRNYLVDTGAGGIEFRLLKHMATEIEFWFAGGRHRAALMRAGPRVTIASGAESFIFYAHDLLEHASETTTTGGDLVLAPMPGLVKDILAIKGAQVSAGSPLLILEAMKMEHTLTAPRDGTIAEILTGKSAQVEEGAILLRLEEKA